jgi:hypothetical protein
VNWLSVNFDFLIGDWVKVKKLFLILTCRIFWGTYRKNITHGSNRIRMSMRMMKRERIEKESLMGKISPRFEQNQNEQENDAESREREGVGGEGEKYSPRF